MRLGYLTAAAVAFATPVLAAPTVDGNYDGDYGAATAVVLYNPTAPNSNFGAPTNESDRIGYSIWLTSDANRIYGYLRADPGTQGLTPIGAFANLYFGLNGGGSNLGFEIDSTRVNAFYPGRAGSASISSALWSAAASADGLGFEFSLDNSLFTAPIAGLNQTGQVFPTIGSSIRLNLSQSFGYSVAGGQSFYGNNRLGTVALGAVPEPATWAMMMLGFGAMGAALRRRAKVDCAVRFA